MSWIRKRNLERIFLLLIGTVLAFLFMKLFAILKKDFENTPIGLAEGNMINLNDGKAGERMRSLLTKGFYFEDPKDISLAAQIVTQGFSSSTVSIENIGALNKRLFNVPTELAFTQGGESYKKRALLSRALIGFVGDDSLRFEQEKQAGPVLASSVSAAMGNYSIAGTVLDPADKFVPGVLIRLQMILPRDSLYSLEITEVDRIVMENATSIRKSYILDSLNHRQLQSMSVYARTDANGRFSFNGLPAGKAFEVLPLKPGFEFGSSKGISSLEKNISFSFRQNLHSIRLFSNRDFNNLKKDKAFIVRTPEEVIEWIWIIAVSFFAAFILLHLLLTIRFPNADQLILPVVMMLTGISLLTLLSLQDPLRDRFLAQSTLWYFVGGFAGICVLLFFDLRRFTTDAGLFRMFVFKRNGKAANGWPWAIAAIVLLVLTIFFGTGPEGSGVKVNLFGFQPSEIVKFLLLIFLAGFFTTNEKFISEYTRWQKRWSFFSFALISIVGSILLFLILGDLGPAMVLCFTFIILFSFSRGDFVFTVTTAVVYVIAIWLLQNIWLATLIIICLLLLSSFFIRKGLSESSVMVIVVMAGFLLLDKIPDIEKVFPGPVKRLADRKAIWQDPWNNEVFGGDHIANSIWGMASGGIEGQGIGEGFAKTIPEAHTDMILPSIGEELGWAGILSIFILFLIFLHRSIVIGRQTGRSFLFYLSAGIGISTFVQFLLIAGGSIGALPLSGVSLPFISYGGSSLILNMLAAGFLLSVSTVQGSTVQLKYLSRQQDQNLLPALLAALTGIILLGVNVSQYLFNNEKWVVQPALVIDRSGARQFSYNPRIGILMNRLGAGNLLDRQGKLLATGKPDLIIKNQDSLVAAGLDKNHLSALSHKRLDRYYPFAEQMFFWTGDANSGIFMGATNGYFAEYEHIAELRGFSTPAVNFNVVASRFREDRFLPEVSTEMTINKRDYSVLSPLLLAGINSLEVEKFKQRNRDVHLTMDAALQTEIQQSLQTIDSLKNSRISVVIMEDSTGDVLTSAAFPLPTINEPEKLSLTISEQNKLPYWITNSDIGFTHASQPGSSAKLVTALAAFNKLGVEARQKTIFVRPGDLIRVKGEEPDESGNITIERAIVRSNNPFFIRLANEERLEEEMGSLYLQSGMFLHGVGGYYYEGDLKNEVQQNKWRELWRNTEFKSIRAYNPDNIRRTRGRGVSGMAWGQGELISSPAAIARIASGIANHGMLIPNRYVLKVSDSAWGVKEGMALVKDIESADLMAKYMKAQSAGKYHRLGIYVAGKTGTPERMVRGERINDGWYVFFAPKANGGGHIVTCIRIENCKGSSVAVRLAGSHIVPILMRRGYIKTFGSEKQTPKLLTNTDVQ
ncbi:MAG: FtsW/RodA/SpoVE family cell cycle protein [Chitinophagaceae bacterium]|nr:FtsW/RodA/SpoVE family cell cycle protein [Chitinophagaceae bacterium]